VRAHAIDDRSLGRQYAERCEFPAVDDRCAIDEDLEFTKMPWNHVHIDLQGATDERRHTDGMESGDSKRAVTDRHAGHC
jgi:hypothetical protein